VTIFALILGTLWEAKNWAPSPETFKAVVTFCMSVLNATTVFIISRFFEVPKKVRGAAVANNGVLVLPALAVPGGGTFCGIRRAGTIGTSKTIRSCASISTFLA
jgi:hypothetical protein